MTTAVETDSTVSPTNTAPEQAVPSWGDAITDPEVLCYIQKKGWSAPADIVQGHRNLEKLVGNEKVPLPKGEQDTDGWERVFTALERPSTPDACKLPDADTAAMFHEVGLNTRQAEAISGWLSESREHEAKTAAEEAAAKRLVELGAVRSDWGVAYEENLRHSERAVKDYALTEHASKIESAVGTANWLKLTAQLGRSLGEHAFASGGAPQFGITKEGAVEQIGALTRDRDFIKRYLSGEHEATVKMKTPHAAAHEQGATPVLSETPEYRIPRGNLIQSPDQTPPASIFGKHRDSCSCGAGIADWIVANFRRALS
jgi:hypothetical protein